MNKSKTKSEKIFSRLNIATALKDKRQVTFDKAAELHTNVLLLTFQDKQNCFCCTGRESFRHFVLDKNWDGVAKNVKAINVRVANKNYNIKLN